MQTIEVGMADFLVANDTFILESKGIGSCVVTCLYDSTRKIGALSHIMLPERPETLDLNPRRFADTALPMALEELERKGCELRHLTAHIVGGASMFEHIGTFINNIGEQNIEAVKRVLADQNIHIVSANIGGGKGRNVTFYLDSGKVVVGSKT
jgi:chemotaxis protein CheD